MNRVFKAFEPSADEASQGDGFDLMPRSGIGKAGILLLLVGFLTFVGGVLSASVGCPVASQVTVAGMLVFFVGGLIRVYSR